MSCRIKGFCLDSLFIEKIKMTRENYFLVAYQLLFLYQGNHRVETFCKLMEPYFSHIPTCFHFLALLSQGYVFKIENHIFKEK